MNYYKNILNITPYLKQEEKIEIFKKNFFKLDKFHRKYCTDYKNFSKFFYSNQKYKNIKIYNYPFMPINIFKDLNLKSIKKNQIYKTMQSSGTSDTKLSKIYLNKENAKMQSIILQKVASKFLNQERLPMLIIDKPSIIDVKNRFSARSAAVLGFSIFAKKLFFALKEDNSINYDEIKKFLDFKNNNNGYLFGFTFLIWKDFYKVLIKLSKKINLSNCHLIHGGGWKKINDIEVSNVKFNFELQKFFNLKKITNYYGMIEQTGSIFFECSKCNCFITHSFSDIFIRNENLQLVDDGQTGLVQLCSLIPTSYPGHNILTEDIGEIVKNQKNCGCYNFGKRFKIYGRAKYSEIRGCSDV